jgi:thioredoxin-dependent peroxiredoxin
MASDFSLPDQDGKLHKLSDYKGKWVVLYFYPKDNTPGCTKEACNFRDSFRELQKLDVQILGVSKDSVASHKKFAEKYSLNFPLLSDESHEVIKKYNAWGVKKFMGREFEGIFRMTYLIDPKGEIKKIYEKVNPLTHASEIIKDLNGT